MARKIPNPSSKNDLGEPLRESKRQYGWNIGADWKIVASITAALASYYITARMERIRLKKQMRLDQVENQVRNGNISSVCVELFKSNVTYCVTR